MQLFPRELVLGGVTFAPFKPIEMNHYSVVLVLDLLHSICDIQTFLYHHKWARPRPIELLDIPRGT